MAIIKCPECGHDVSTMAAACPNCGYPISGMNLEAPEQPEHEEPMEEPKPQNAAPDEFDPIKENPEQPQKEPSAEKPKKSGGANPSVVLAFIIIFAIIAFVFFDSSKRARQNSEKPVNHSSSSYSSSRSSGSSYSSSEIESGVYTLAKKCVKNHLKSPSSAKFCSMSDCEFEKGSGNTYIMAGTVESENSYGAMLTETWGIVAEVDGDKVSLVMLQIGDSIYSD